MSKMGLMASLKLNMLINRMCITRRMSCVNDHGSLQPRRTRSFIICREDIFSLFCSSMIIDPPYGLYKVWSNIRPFCNVSVGGIMLRTNIACKGEKEMFHSVSFLQVCHLQAVTTSHHINIHHQYVI